MNFLMILSFFKNNILINYKNTKEHKLYIGHVLKKLKNWGLYAKIEKYVFYTTYINFVGYHISNEGIVRDPKKVQPITD